jgi:hypothetical protein
MRPYELACIQGWELSLQGGARDIFRRQFARLDRYKRLKDGRTLFLFPTGGPNGVPLPTDLRFALREIESRVARVRMEFPSTPNIRVDAVVVLQQGQVTSLEFSGVLPRECWSDSVIQGVEILRDVMSQPEELQSRHGELPPNLAWLTAGQLDFSWELPRPDAEIQTFISSFETTFPQDYEAILRVTNGFSAGPVVIYGIGNAWTIPRPDGPYVSIANVRDVGELVVKIGDKSGALFLLDFEGDLVRPLQGNLSEALRKSVAAPA